MTKNKSIVFFPDSTCSFPYIN